MSRDFEVSHIYDSLVLYGPSRAFVMLILLGNLIPFAIMTGGVFVERDPFYVPSFAFGVFAPIPIKGGDAKAWGRHVNFYPSHQGVFWVFRG